MRNSFEVLVGEVGPVVKLEWRGIMEFGGVEVGVLLLRSWCFGEPYGALAIANTCDGHGLETLTVECVIEQRG